MTTATKRPPETQSLQVKPENPKNCRVSFIWYAVSGNQSLGEAPILRLMTVISSAVQYFRYLEMYVLLDPEFFSVSGQ